MTSAQAFDLAVANWHRAMTGLPPHDSIAADKFGRLVEALHPDLRRAWRIKHGVDPDDHHDDMLVDSYIAARVALALAWQQR